jgi:hypothetical protein
MVYPTYHPPADLAFDLLQAENDGAVLVNVGHVTPEEAAEIVTTTPIRNRLRSFKK